MEESVKKVGLKSERGSWRSNEMEGRCDSDCGGDEVYPAAFGYEEKTGLKLDSRRKKKKGCGFEVFLKYVTQHNS